jgi:hypothetical protein
MTKISNRADLRAWVEEQMAVIEDAREQPEAVLEAAIEASTDALAACARKDGLLYGRNWEAWLDERGEAALLEHLVATGNSAATG